MKNIPKYGHFWDILRRILRRKGNIMERKGVINKLASLEATLLRNSAHLLTDGGEV